MLVLGVSFLDLTGENVSAICFRLSLSAVGEPFFFSLSSSDLRSAEAASSLTVPAIRNGGADSYKFRAETEDRILDGAALCTIGDDAARMAGMSYP